MISFQADLSSLIFRIAKLLKPWHCHLIALVQCFWSVPKESSGLLKSLTFSLAHRSLSQHIFINTSLDLCNTSPVLSSAQLSVIFVSKVCVTDTRLCKISLWRRNSCLWDHSILSTNWVTSKFKTSPLLHPTLSFFSPIAFIAIQSFHHSPYPSMSWISANTVPFLWVFFSYPLQIQSAYFLVGLIQISNPSGAFPDHLYSSVGFELEFSQHISWDTYSFIYTWFF